MIASDGITHIFGGRKIPVDRITHTCIVHRGKIVESQYQVVFVNSSLHYFCKYRISSTRYFMYLVKIYNIANIAISKELLSILIQNRRLSQYLMSYAIHTLKSTLYIYQDK